MLEDVLLLKDHHYQAAEQILQKLLPLNSNRTVIGISGESGAGKSELAHVLGRKIRQHGKLAKILHIDNYYKVPPQEKTAWRKKHGIDKVGLDEINWELINKNIREFREGKKAKMPCVDLLTDLTDELITDFKPIDYLIVEGLYSLKADVDLRIFITLTYYETKKAQLLRGKEPQDEFRFQVLEQEHKVVQSLRPLADLIVTNDYTVTEAEQDGL
ncbi:uridine kinase family protein [Calditrichota bacterium GD2]